MNFDNKIKRMLGTTKKFGGKNDLDGDGVPNRKDCQPRNTMRQDGNKVIMKWSDGKRHTVTLEESKDANGVWYNLYEYKPDWGMMMESYGTSPNDPNGLKKAVTYANSLAKKYGMRRVK